MTTTTEITIGELVIARPSAVRVLERHGIDYCRGGHRTLDDACRAAGIDPVPVFTELDELPPEEPEAWTGLAAPALAEHIVATHHAYLHEELPLLVALAEKVLSVHGDRHPELAEVERLVTAVAADLRPHLVKEERVLFPAVAQLEEGERDFPFGSIATPIRVMLAEHDQAGELLEQLRGATDGYQSPTDACASYRSLYERLAHLEADTHLHVHKENNILFPAVLRRAQS